MAYDLLLVADRGCSEAVVSELKIRNFDYEVEKGDLFVKVKSVSREDVVRAAYFLQTPLRIVWLLGETEVFDDTEDSVVNLELLLDPLDLVVPGKSVFVKCDRFGNQEYNSVDMSQAVARILYRKFSDKGVDFLTDNKNPDLVYYLLIDEGRAFFGLDLVGKDLSKRHYKVFNNPHSIKGPTAASFLLLSGWVPGKVLLDPYCAGGVLGIEAALLASNKSIHFYDKSLKLRNHPDFSDADSLFEAFDKLVVDPGKSIFCFDAQLRNVTAAKKNAKLAGVFDFITFSKLDVEWLDTRLSGGSVDFLVTQPIEPSKHVPESRAKRFQEELFYQADYLLSPGGVIGLLLQKPDFLLPIAEQRGFVVVNESLLMTGSLGRWVLVLSKSS